MKMDTRLFEACMSGDEQALQTLIQHDPLLLDRAVTCCEETPLHVAVLRGHLTLVRTLLRLKPKLAAEADATGCSPLHLASADGSLEIVRELSRANAELCGARDSRGRTPLHLAVMKGRLDVVRELIRVCPGSVSERLDRGETVFHLAVKYCRLDALKLLVELLEDDRRQMIVATDEEGNTVLHFAAFFKQIKTVRFLVSLEEVKAIANATNGNGHTALDDVVQKNPRDFSSFEIMETLSQFGVRRGKDEPNNPNIVLHSSLPTTTNSAHTYTSIQSRIKRGLYHGLEYLTVKYQMDWIADAHGNLMVVATVIASIAFQAGINPPGGVWQEDTIIENHYCSRPGMCRAGTAVLKDDVDFHYFYSSNTWALMAAVGVVLLHFGGLPLKNKVGTWLMTLTACLMLHNILGAYTYSTRMVIDNSRESRTLLHIGYAWQYMLTLIVIIHTARIWYWLMFDKVTSFVSPGNILCRSKSTTTMACLVGTVATLFMLKLWVGLY